MKFPTTVENHCCRRIEYTVISNL